MKEHRLLQALGRCSAKNSAEDHEQIAGVGGRNVILVHRLFVQCEHGGGATLAGAGDEIQVGQNL